MDVQQRVLEMKQRIEDAAIDCGLNLTVHDGKIAFIDQTNWRIVALWEPQHKMPEIMGGN